MHHQGHLPLQRVGGSGGALYGWQHESRITSAGFVISMDKLTEQHLEEKESHILSTFFKRFFPQSGATRPEGMLPPKKMPSKAKCNAGMRFVLTGSAEKNRLIICIQCFVRTDPQFA